MGEIPRRPAGPFAEETPRRGAVRAIGAAGAALLGALGLSASADARAQNGLSAEGKKRGKRGKRGRTGPPGPPGPPGPGLSDLVLNRRPGSPFDVASGSSGAGSAECEADELLVGGGYNIAGMSGACVVMDAEIDPQGEWAIAMVCATGNSATGVTPIAHCLAQ